MNPFSNNSSICFLNSANSAGAMRYGGIEIGEVPGIKSIQNSISLSGGRPGNSSGKTSQNSSTTSIRWELEVPNSPSSAKIIPRHSKFLLPPIHALSKG